MLILIAQFVKDLDRYQSDGVVIVPGVTIGDNTVIGAGSIVTKDIPTNVVAVGNPCRVLREISSRDREFFYRDEPIDWEELEGLIQLTRCQVQGYNIF